MTRARYGLLALALLALAGCSDVSWGPSHFVAADEVPPTVIPAPPAVNSPGYNIALRQVIVGQAHVSKAKRAAILDEDRIDPSMMIRPTLGRRYSPDCYPALYTLLNNAKDDALHISNNAEDHWKNKRPWTNKSVHAYAPVIDRPSYPSGHTVTNFVWADILSSIFPAKSGAFHARAQQIGDDRVLAGAHFPYDVSAGKDLSSIIYAKMRQSPEFKRELKAAKAEVRAGRKNRCPRSIVPDAGTGGTTN